MSKNCVKVLKGDLKLVLEWLKIKNNAQCAQKMAFFSKIGIFSKNCQFFLKNALFWAIFGQK